VLFTRCSIVWFIVRNATIILVLCRDLQQRKNMFCVAVRNFHLFDHRWSSIY
jgi:hypothetical protein